MTESDRPMLRVVRGEPSAEELAAVVAVLASRAAADGGAPDRAVGSFRSAWSRGRGVRRPLPTPGPGAWRAAARGSG